MKWTVEQQKAIDKRGVSLLVSAAAGSGKTAVLIERIKKILLEERVPVNRIMVVTFTNAAASEMKEKLVKALNKEIKVCLEDPDRGEDLEFLKKQLSLIPEANISTFHSFAISVLRRYFEVINLDPNFKICDEVKQVIMLEESLDSVLEEEFEKGAPDFLDFMEKFTTDKGNGQVRAMILETYKTIQSIPKPFKWLSNSVKKVQLSEESFEDSLLRMFIELDFKEVLLRVDLNNKFIYDALVDAKEVKLIDKYAAYIDSYEGVQKKAEKLSFNEMRDILVGLSKDAPQLRGSKSNAKFNLAKDYIKELKETNKKLIDGILKDGEFALTMEDWIRDSENSAAAAATLERLVNSLHEKYRAAKTDAGVIDFSDIEHYALEVLDENLVGEDYENKFNYVFVDEYQDSNEIQDRIVNIVSNIDNSFMVGDVKQSIYKFRLAEPEIFIQRYEAYKLIGSTYGEKIDLNKNFRSKGGIIKCVNATFEFVMPGYDEESMLYKGVPYEGELEYPAELHVVDIEKNSENDELNQLKNAELEALAAVKIIKENVGLKIYDVKQDCERLTTLKDIVILMRGAQNYADVFADILVKSGIPAYCDVSEGYYGTHEISVIIDLIRVIDNLRNDTALMAVLRSPIFGFSIDELVEIRTRFPYPAYCDAFTGVQKGDDELALKCRNAAKQLQEWKVKAQSMPLEDFIWELIYHTGYYLYAGALPNGDQRQANLRALADKAIAARDADVRDLYSFIKYIENIKFREISTGEINIIGENEDVVRIMTIHKSKGLEFPVVIVAGLGKQIKLSERNANVSVEKSIGLGISCVNTDEHWRRKSLLQNVIGRKMRRDSLEEEIRILYVAYTRAMDKLILLGAYPVSQKSVPKEIVNIFGGSYMDYIMALNYRNQKAMKGPVCYTRDSLAGENSQEESEAFTLEEFLKQNTIDTESEKYRQIDEKLSYTYEYMRDVEVRSKYSVSELNEMKKQELSPGEYSRQKIRSKPVVLKKLFFGGGEKEEKKRCFTAAEKGTILHRVFEVTDFREAGKAAEAGNFNEFMETLFAELLEKGIFLPEELAIVDTKHVQDFVESDLGRRIVASSHIRKEQPFTHARELNGSDILIQGIIDCYFQEGDDLVLVDYKNSYINFEDEDNYNARIEDIKQTYQEQICAYANALEEITGKKVKERYLYLIQPGAAVEL